MFIFYFGTALPLDFMVELLKLSRCKCQFFVNMPQILKIACVVYEWVHYDNFMSSCPIQN